MIRVLAPVSVTGAQHSRLSHVVAVAGPCRLCDRDKPLQLMGAIKFFQIIFYKFFQIIFYKAVWQYLLDQGSQTHLGVRATLQDITQ